MNARRLLIAAASAACLPAPAAGASPRPARARSGDFPNPRLETHTGRPLRFYDDVVKKNQVVLFNMMYASCSNICPPNTARLREVQALLGERMGRDVFFYSLTLQPDVDRPPDLMAYTRRYGVGPGWTFLTGKRQDIDAIRRKLGFFDPDPAVDADLMRHTGMVRIGSAALDRWSMMPSLLSPGRLARSIVELAG